MVASSDIVSKACLEALFVTDEPRSWRLRTVLQITPVSRTAYRARTSIQFSLTPRLIERVWDGLSSVFSGLPPTPGDGDQVEIILPLEYLPKYVLLDFSLLDQSGKPIALLTSGETTNLSFGVVRFAMEKIDQLAADGRQDAVKFLDDAERIIYCLVATGQREIASRLSYVGSVPHHSPATLEFIHGMLHFVADGFHQACGRQLDHGVREICHRGISDFCGLLETMNSGLKDLLGGPDGLHSPLLNPLTLVVDYFRRYHGGGDDPARTLQQFFASCRAFTSKMDSLADDELRFWTVFRILDRFTRSYPAYARMSVPIGRDFIVKIDQLIPGESTSLWRHPIQRMVERNYQWYPFRTGDTRSLHIEVICDHPLELEQVPRATRLRVGGRLIPRTMLFGRAGYNTKYEQHFYTQKTAEELQTALGDRRKRSMFDFKVGVKFRVELATRISYRLIAIVVFAALFALIVVYDPVKLRKGETNLLPLVPILFALFGALGSLKPQENLVALSVRKYKIAVLSVGALMSLYFLVGLVFPGVAFWVRALVKSVAAWLRLV